MNKSLPREAGFDSRMRASAAGRYFYTLYRKKGDSYPSFTGGGMNTWWSGGNFGYISIAAVDAWR
ncbi:MAG TPA: hypothetical protein VLL97_08210 [Acidobacteriota bacterium]|nr:hypothetical protein [Acidobacteriota bacterium]